MIITQDWKGTVEEYRENSPENPVLLVNIFFPRFGKSLGAFSIFADFPLSGLSQFAIL
jgi:hypothetical protein